MDIVALVAITVAITQVVKGLLTSVSPNIIAGAVTLLVVAYKVVESGTPITIALVVIIVQVYLGAIGSFKVAQQVLAPKPY